MTTPIFTNSTTNPFGLGDVGNYASLTLTDIDGDGDLDALVGNNSGNTLFFENTGTASSPVFASAIINPFGLADVGSNASPTFADIDGDGDLDALVGNWNGDTLFYQNTGTATSAAFASATTNPFGLSDVGYMANPTLVDIDGDGDLDALVGERYGSTMFFENTGSATSAAFAAVTTNPFGLSDVDSQTSPTFVDIDGDGDLDALIGNQAGNSLFYQNTGTATSPAFAAATTNPFGLGNVGYNATPTFVDIDGDGDLDALVGNFFGDTVLFTNQPATTPPITPGITLTQSNGNTAVTEGGATDSYTLVLDSAPTADVTITLGNTNSQVGTDVTTLTFTAANWNVAQTVTVNAVNDTMGEFTNSGVINYTVTRTDANYNNFAVADTIVTVTDNDLPVGNPTFQAAITNPFGLGNVGAYARPTFVDIDGDGDLDTFVGNGAGNILFYQNTGSATSAAFAPATANPFGLSDEYRYSYAMPTFVDIDADGDLDALVGDWYGQTLYYQNTGTATSPAFAVAITYPFGLSDAGSFASPTFVDIDGDGDLDAFVGNNVGNTLFYQNTGTATSAAFAAATTNPFGLDDVGSSAKPTFVDIDGDGDLDAFVGDWNSGTSFFNNTGSETSPAFAVASSNPFGLIAEGNGSRPTFVDIDGDGDLDALVGNAAGDTLFYVNNNPPTSTDDAVTTLEDTAVVLSTSDFGTYSDSSVGNTATAFAAVKITTLATAGSLEYNNGTNWVAVTLNQVVSVTDIDGGKLRFTPVANANGDAYTAIGFKVSDGTTFSTTANTLTVNVTPVADVIITPTQSGGKVAVTEGDATDSYTVVLDQAPTADVTITLGNTNGQVSTDITTLTFTAANWNVAQTVTVTAINDTVGEFTNTGVINYTVTSTDANYNNLAVANTIVTVTDNDLLLGNATFQPASTNSFGLTKVGYSANPTFVDIDGDGDFDALVGIETGNILFYQNTGNASSPAFATASTNPFGLSDVGRSASPTFVDIDGDGDLDAFVGEKYGNTLFYQNTGTATSAAFATATINPFGLRDVGYYAKSTLVDIDGDGDLDAFTGNSDGNTLFYQNTGSATSAAFTAPTTNPFGLNDAGRYAHPTFVDIDGDGDLDALVGNRDGNTLFYQNTGSATSVAFAAATTNPFGLSDVGLSASPTFVDIDGDGDLDAFVGELYGNTLFFVNNNPPTSTDDALTTLEDTSVALSTSDFGVYSDSSVGNTATAFAAVKITTLASAGTLEYNNGTNWVTVTLNQVVSVADIDVGKLRFTPGLNGEGAGYATVGFKVSDGTTFSTTANTLTLNVTPVNDAPVIGGVTAVTAVNDNATTTPFSAFTIADPDAGASVTVSVSLDTAAKGSFTAASLTASGFIDVGNGVYTHTAATLANAQAAIRALVFVPTANQVAPGNTETTTFTVSVNDGIAAAVINNSTTVVSTSVNDAPVIGGVTAVTTISDTVTVTPFSALTITDIDFGASETVTVTLDNAAKGSFTAASLTASGFTAAGAGVYSHTADTPAALQAAIELLVFAPTAGRVAPGSSETTTFTVSVSEGIAAAVINNSTTVVTAGSANTAPSATNLNQTIAYQVNNTAPIADIVITDPDINPFTATLSLASKNSTIGSLTATSGHGETYNAATGMWTVSGTKADVNAALAAVSFVPVTGGVASTTVAVSVSDGMAPALTGTLTLIKGIFGDNAGNTLTGTKGNDFISGGAYPSSYTPDGKDTMTGLAGNDIYIVNDSTDVVVETGKTESDHTGGIDAVWSSATYNAQIGIENIIATGSGATTLGGNNLNNILDGSQASGANILVGGSGNDTYYLGAGDSVVELAAGGTDLVYSYGSIDMTSWFNFENATLQGSASESLTGNTLANVLTGNIGANLLIGDAGKDTLTGLNGKDTLDGGLGNDILVGGTGKDVLMTGAGNDVLRYAAGVTDTTASAGSIAGVDWCKDFDFKLDKVDLTVKVATKGLTVTGALSEANFVSNMNTLLQQGGGAGFNTAVVGDISGAIVTANAGDLSGRSFLAVDLDHSNSFTAADFVIEITGATNLASLALTSFI
jgi:hypothetical protein